MQRHRASVTFWQPLSIAYTEAMQRVPSVFVQLYFLTMLVMITALMMRRNAMEIMLNREKVTRRVQKKLRRMIIAAMQWTLLTIVTGKDKTIWGKVKSSTHILCRWKKYYEKIDWDYWPRKKCQYALRSAELSHYR